MKSNTGAVRVATLLTYLVSSKDSFAISDIKFPQADKVTQRQHLYRVHCKPKYYCESCFEVFSAREHLTEHARRRPAYEIQVPLFTERVTDEQVRELKKKHPGQSIAEGWFMIFRILFPTAPLPVSPCKAAGLLMYREALTQT